MSTRKPLNALDRTFLASERRDVMMHVGGLLIFTPPSRENASAELLRELRDELARDPHVVEPYSLKLAHPELLSSPVQSWTPDAQVDVDYHVRRSALPSPGDERELGILVSRLHGTPLDFHHPPWEAHFIERLEGGRFAIYFKCHHALIDGYTGMRLLTRSLSTDPNERDTPLFFEREAATAKRRRADEEEHATLSSLMRAGRDQLGAAKDVGRAILNLARSSWDSASELVAPQRTPKSVLNQRITRSRRFATQHVPLERARRVAGAAGGTVNDVALATCGAALRRFLLDQGDLPDRPLIAMLPVNIRPKDDPGGGGNAVGAILASLATDIVDPAERLAVIIRSTRAAKEQLQGMSKSAILQYTALLMAPLLLALVPATAGRVRPAFNVVISNVPGPETPLYFRGWRLERTYPLSIPFHGYALNITLQSYAGTLHFGFTGCRDTLPHMQRLAVYSGEAFEELAHAVAR